MKEYFDAKMQPAPAQMSLELRGAAPTGFAPPPPQAELDAMRGTFLLGGAVQLLTAPAWNDEKQRWQALANVNGMLCVIQVGIKSNGIPCHGG